VSAKLTGLTGKSVVFRQLTKHYGDFVALRDIELAIEAGEFFTLLGPSGSGKTTLLKVIAGFERHSNGQIEVDGADISHVPVARRNIGMVFQNYALFPHMSVFDNVGFSLSMRRQPKAEIEQRVLEALRVVDLEGFAKRYPRQLSGGQQQRVAVARAIVFNPDILLMDEPLGALDKNLRQSLQIELKRLHRRLGVTIVYVTHDQEEAMHLSDRIVVLNEGRIEQIGTPEELYHRPANRFVADFIGECNHIRLAEQRVAGVRPEKLKLGAQAEHCIHRLQAKVTEWIFLGTGYKVLLNHQGSQLTALIPSELHSDDFRLEQDLTIGFNENDVIVWD